MRTNIDKFNYYKNIIVNQEWDFLQSITDYPKELYEVLGSGIVRTYTFDHFSYKHPVSLFFHIKPTKEDVTKLAQYAASKIDFATENVLWCYGYKDSFGAATGCWKFNELKSKNLYFDVDLAQQQAEIIADFNKRVIKKDVSFDYKEYKFLGWQNGWKHVYYDKNFVITTDNTKRVSFGYTKEDYPEYGLCRELKHPTFTVQHNSRGSEMTVSCDICKIYWKYDCSD